MTTSTEPGGAATFHRLRSISVTGGFLDRAQFDLCDGLNCLIGPRGTGKTTALEFVRYALDAFPDAENGIEIRVKVYRGMASSEVQREHYGGLADWKTAEGVSTEVPYREDEDEIIADIIGGLRSGLTYGGADSIRELQRKLDFIEITPASRLENLAHRIL